MNVTSRITLVAALLLAAAPAAATNGMRMIGFGPVQNSMGGVGVGAALDSATIVTNPAGMADLGKRVDAAVTYFAPSVDYKAVWTPDGTNFFPAAEESNRDPSFIPTLGLVYTLNDKVAAGIGVVGTAGMGVDYDADLFGSSLMTSYMNLRVAPAVSYKINDQFAVGLAANLMYAMMEWDVMDAMGNPAREDGSAFGFGATIGLTYKPIKDLTVGLAYESKSFFGDFEFDLGAAGTEKLDFDQPQIVTVGGSYKVLENLLVAADVEWINWSDTNGEDMPEFTEETPATSPWNMDWSDQVVVKIGAELAATKELKIRAGYNYGKMPLNEDRAFENVAFPAIAEHHITLGAGYDIGALTVNVGGAYSPEAKIEGSGMFAYETTMSQVAIDLGIAYKF